MKKYQDLTHRLAVTFMLIAVYSLGQSIPVPLFDMSFRVGGGQVTTGKLLSMITGGVFNSPTLFSLGMGPYMVVSILTSIIFLAARDRMSQMSQDQKGLLQIWMTLIFAMLQVIPLTFNILNNAKPIVHGFSPLQLFLTTALIFITGAMIAAWMAGINAQFGVGGPFVMIIPGIVTGITGSLKLVNGSILMHLDRLLILLAVTIVFMYLTTALYSAEYRMDVQRIGIDRRSKDGYFAFRILIGGTMPLMFATTFMYFPIYIMQALKYHNTTVMNLFDVTKIQGIWMYGIVIYLLGFAFSFVNVVPDQTAKDMKESGDYVIGVQPGITTERYITRRVIFFAVFGSMFLAIVVIFPMLLGYWLHNRMYTNLSNYFAMLFVLISIFDNLRQDIDMLYYKDSYGLFNVKVKRRGRAS